ncbi:GNAT family N-acetyltransferase [Actinophytocola sp.]|uniref:GNAT family N-acetyltransferase n=1 Tax=Actinophytocola sp. TaxID=1872138 RepID=UPI002D371329|nr:GNAT family N-acetyltransferase [Actinophytocola sp.]HYQ65277.1 GNAT family N-acetyltransferase [Actinophytocola sp.]
MIRVVQPGDGEALARMMNRCSPRTTYERFHGVVTEIPHAYLRSCLSGAHLALVAEQGSEIVGLASMARDEDVPEIGVVIEDGWQGRGLGRALVAALVEKADTPVVRMELCRASLLDYVKATFPIVASASHGCDVTLDVDLGSAVQ